MARESLISLGVCIGKFTHSNKFILTIGALDILAQHAKYKVRRHSAALRLPGSPRPTMRKLFSLQTDALASAAD